MTSDDRSQTEEATRFLPSAVFITMPPEPEHRRSPVRSFRVVNELAQLESHYEGRGLTPDRVTAALTEGFADAGFGCAVNPYDLTVYEGRLVAAVVRNFGDGQGTFRVLKIGTRWIWMAEDDGIDFNPPAVPEKGGNS